MVCKVAALNLTPLDTYQYPKEVAWEIDQNSKAEYLELAREINQNPKILGVIIQHEYGIFGGTDGQKILHFMQRCQKPMLVTLHTVLPFPEPSMKAVTAEIIKLAQILVVLTQKSKEIVEDIYPASVGKVQIIPHGIHHTDFSPAADFKKKLDLEPHLVLTTFGLLSPGKGIEYVIQALPEVIRKYPNLIYLILGETHPVIRRQEGEKYRITLSKLVRKLHLNRYVKFYDQYLSLPELQKFLKATDIYISTSTNPNQAVSGTLSYALGAGRAVISTEFTQAKEMVTPDIGRLVPIKDAPALTAAILDLLGNQQELARMSQVAYQNTRPMLWNTVAEQYLKLLNQWVVPPLNLQHLQTMTDDFGLFQFASFDRPARDFGYTLDDNARALVFTSRQLAKKPNPELSALMTVYLQFIHHCQLADGSFINYVDYQQRQPTPQNQAEDLEDAHARAMWSVAEVMSNPHVTPEQKLMAQEIFTASLPKGQQLTHLRAQAFAIKALVLAIPELPLISNQLQATLTSYAESLLQAVASNRDRDWLWFEPELIYNNGVLPEALIIAGQVTGKTQYSEMGVNTLQFLIEKTFSDHMYRPIGHALWYKNNAERSSYDQQPEDPASMIQVLVTAYHSTQDPQYKALAHICFSWFLGHNTLKTCLYNPQTGGCYDGLHPDRVNLNQGAESLVSFLMSAQLIRAITKK